ncbi:MAG: hypothetical protein A2132_01730 [Nitrospirae bacterium RBG_16_43_11]|nr:MAG: hypothetical protein A2132_01730 [Nitrospirae bacterium RBG_16_43_11]
MSSILRRTFNNIFWLFIGEVCAKGVVFLTTLYLARVLGIDGFGKFSLALAMSTYMWIFVDMGITGYGTREIARDREKISEIFRILNSLRLVLAVVSFLILIIFLHILNIPLDMRMILLAGGFYVIAYALSPDWVLRGIERMEYIALGNAVMSIVFLLTVYLFVRAPDDTVSAVLYRSFSFLLGSFVALIILKRTMNVWYAFEISLSKWLFHLRESFYFAVNGGLNNIAMYIPVFFLGLWAAMEDVGIFSAPQRAIVLIINTVAVIQVASYPVMSNLYVSDKYKFYLIHKTIERVMLYIGLPIGVMGMILSKEIISTLYGNMYETSSAIFRVMIWIVPLTFLRSNYGRTLLSAGFHRFNMFATGSGAVVTILLCILFIPTYRGTGAAISVLAGEAVILIIMGVMFGIKLYRSYPFDVFFIKIVIASITAGLIVRIADLPLFYSAVLGVILYFGISFFLGIITVGMIRDICSRIIQRRVGIV